PAPAPQPTPPPDQPTPTPPASSTPTPAVTKPSQPCFGPSPRATPKTKSTPTPKPSAGAKANATLPPGLTQPTFDIPQLARTAPKNTLKLMQELEPRTKFGFTLQQVRVQGTGRFPVAGGALCRDDRS